MTHIKHVVLGAMLRLFGATNFASLLLICLGMVFLQSDLTPLYKWAIGGLFSIVSITSAALYKLFADNLKLRETQFETRTKALEQTLTTQASIVADQAKIIENKHKEQAENVNTRAEAIEDALKQQTDKLTYTIVTEVDKLRCEQKELGAIITLQATTDRELNNQRHHNNVRCELAIFKAIKKVSPDAQLDEGMLLLPPLPSGDK